jgi:prepilin-type N-terminal cleavage/methylation domain-containing protein
MRPPRQPQEGFTLVELLIGVVINGLIMSAIASALFVGLRTTTDARRNLGQSNGEQLIAYYFTGDVQSACNPALSEPACARTPNPSTTSGSACGTTAQFAMDTFSTPTASAPEVTVGYGLQSGVLTRFTCAYGATSTSSSVTLAEKISSVAVTYPISGTCAGRYQLVVIATGSTEGIGTPAYTFTLCAERRSG